MDTKDKELPIRLQPTSNKPPDTKDIIIIIKINKIIIIKKTTNIN